MPALTNTVLYRLSLEYTDCIPAERYQVEYPDYDTKLHQVVRLSFWIAQSAGAVEYTYCISAKE